MKQTTISDYDERDCDQQISESSAGKADSSKIRLGISISLLSRFTSSINTILADRFLGRDRKTRIGVYECAFFNAIIPFAVIWFALLFSDEATTWASQLTGKSTMNTFTITCVVTMICFAKWGDRISKFSVVQKASTMLFAIVDANMKFIAVIGTLVFFRQQVTIGQLFGFAFIFLSLCCSLYDKKLKVAEDQRKEQLKLEKEAAEEQEGGLRESELSVISTNTNNTLDKKTTRSLSVTHKMSFMGEGTNEEGGVHGTKNPMQTEMAAPSSEGEI